MEKLRKILRIFLSCMPIFLMALYLLTTNIFASVMSSGNYRIEADDSPGAGGGNYTSTNYIFRDTLGEVSTGVSDSISYRMRAGYQEMLEAYLTVSSPADIDLLPPIPGISGGTANASASWNVICDSPSGFNMQIAASTTPAMILGGNDPTHYFANYSSTPTYAWSVASGNSLFGYTVEPATTADTAQTFLDNGSDACGTGELNGSDTCWAGFNGTTAASVINKTSRTSIAGEPEKIKVRAQSNNNFLLAGTYQSSITVTVLQN